MKLDLPKKRHAVLYVRVSDEAKEWIMKQAQDAGVSESAYVEALIAKANDLISLDKQAAFKF